MLSSAVAFWELNSELDFLGSRSSEKNEEAERVEIDLVVFGSSSLSLLKNL